VPVLPPARDGNAVAADYLRGQGIAADWNLHTLWLSLFFPLWAALLVLSVVLVGANPL